MLRGIKRQQNLTDRSLLWLKDLYIQLYFENKGQPLVADAIKVTTTRFVYPHLHLLCGITIAITKQL